MAESKKNIFLSWAASVAGWLVCAALCLLLAIDLENRSAYEIFYPVVILLLFANVFLFLFVAMRWGALPRRLFDSIARICIGEGLLLLMMDILGRYVIK